MLLEDRGRFLAILGEFDNVGVALDVGRPVGLRDILEKIDGMCPTLHAGYPATAKVAH